MKENVSDGKSEKGVMCPMTGTDRQFRSAFHASAIGMALVDLQGRFLSVNQSLSLMFGYSPEEMMTRTFMDITHPDDVEKSLAEREALMNSKDREYFTIEKRYHHKKGHIVWGKLTVSLVRDENDAPLYAIAQVQDITEAKEAERALRESEERYRSLTHGVLDNAAVGLFILDRQFHVVWINSSSERYFGLRREEVVGRDKRRLIKKQISKIMEDPESFASKVMAAYDDNTYIERFECHVLPVRGCEDRWLEHWSQPITTGRYAGGRVEYYTDITERKKAEIALNNSEKHLRYILKHDPNAIAVFDKKLNYIAVSDRYLKDYGVKETDLLGRNHYAVFPEMPERWKAIHRRVLLGAIEKNEDDYFERPDGSITYNRWECRPWYTPEGTIGGMILYTEVTTERKLAEKNLQESEERFRRSFENAFIGVALVAPDGRILEVNERFSDIIGYRHDDLVGKTVGDFVHPDDRMAGGGNMCLGRSQEADSNSFQQRLVHKDGHIVWGEVCSSLIRGTNGEPLYSICHLQDVTQRVLAERQLKQTKHLLETAEMIASQGAWEWDVENDKGTVSENWRKIHGCSNCNFSKTELFALAHPDDVPAIDNAFQKALSGDSPYEIDHRIIREDTGEIRHVRAVGEVVFDDGKPVKMWGTSRDITRQKQIEKEKHRLETDLRHAHKMEAIGTLAGGVAHDFNNILCIILGYTELARNRTPEGLPVRKYLDEIWNASNRAKDIVQQILAYSRKTDQERTPVEMAPAVRDALKLVRSITPKGIDIIERIEPDAGTIRIESSQVGQILINLATNAMHAMPDGGTLAVHLSSKELKEPDLKRFHGLPACRYVILSVSDTGQGIPEKDIDRIFDPYFTTKGVGKGSGMGLAVVHGIVTSSDGAIAVSSTPGKGTTFDIIFPAIEEKTIQPAGANGSLPTGKENILLVDDETAIVDMNRARLEALGYTVYAFSDSTEALEAFRKNPDAFDLVITDMAMPKLDGDKLVHQIREVRDAIPIILCTGYSEKVDVETASTIGVSAYLEKPVDSIKLAVTMRNLLNDYYGASNKSKPSL